MRRIPVFIVCIILLSSIAQLAVAQQWPSGDWNSEVMVTNDSAHWNLRNTGEGVTREGNMFTIKAGGDDIGGRNDIVGQDYASCPFSLHHRQDHIASVPARNDELARFVNLWIEQSSIHRHCTYND